MDGKITTSAYSSMALVILATLYKSSPRGLPLVVNQSALDSLATETEKNIPEYEHDGLVKALWKLVKAGRKAESTVLIGRGYFDITTLVKEAKIEHIKQQASYWEREAKMNPANEFASNAYGDYRAQLAELLNLGTAREDWDSSQPIAE